MVKRVKDLFRGRKKPGQPEEVKVKRQSVIRSDLDSVMEAVTFAEAGLADHARELMRRERVGPRKILVVQKGDSVTPAVMDYALELAARLGSALVFLNVVEVPGTQEEPLPPYKQHLLRSDRERAFQSACGYRQRAGPVRSRR